MNIIKKRDFVHVDLQGLEDFDNGRIGSPRSKFLDYWNRKTEQSKSDEISKFYAGSWNLPLNKLFSLKEHPQFPIFKNKYESFKSIVSPHGQQTRTRRRYSPEDGELCIDRVKARSQTPFIQKYKSTERTRTSGKFAKIIIEIGGHHGRTEEQLEYAGLAAAAIADRLEENKTQTEIVLVDLTQPNLRTQKIYFVSLPVKRVNERLDLNRLAFLTSGQFYRTKFMQLLSTVISEKVDSQAGAYCIALQAKMESIDLLPKSENSIIIPEFTSREQAEQFCKNIFKNTK